MLQAVGCNEIFGYLHGEGAGSEAIPRPGSSLEHAEALNLQSPSPPSAHLRASHCHNVHGVVELQYASKMLLHVMIRTVAGWEAHRNPSPPKDNVDRSVFVPMPPEAGMSKNVTCVNVLHACRQVL